MGKKAICEDRPWLAHYDTNVPESIVYEETCVPDFLDRSARNYPNRTAFSFQGHSVTFARFNEMVNRFAACLVDFGVRKGDAVAILLPNIMACPVSYYATVKLGAVAVMNNPLYTDRELAHQFNDSSAKVLVTLDLLCNRMIDLRPKTGIRQIVYTSIGDYLPFPKNLLFPFVAKGKGLAARVKSAGSLFRWKTVLKRYPPAPPAVTLTFDDVAMYQYTGGTTGTSKGAILTHGNLSKNVQQISAWIPEYPSGGETMLGALPFFHVMGLTVSLNLSVYKGWGNVLVPKPQPDPLLEAISQSRPTIAPLVPTMFIGLLNHPQIESRDLTSIKMCISGSAPLALEVIRDFEQKTGSIIIEAFGMTECAPAVHVNPMARGKRKTGSVGIPLPDTDCRIVDVSDPTREMPPGAAGELLVKGPQVMQGYLNMPEETAGAFTDGWLRTGDIARMDEDGYFFIVDRLKDMIISGGYNVYPRDIDEVLFEHPKVVEACAIGVPHPTRGEQVKAFVVLAEGETATEQEIIEHCAGRLARYKLPTTVAFRKDLPRTNVGKILRKDLRAQEMKKASN